jgi:hypothetical protein
VNINRGADDPVHGEREAEGVLVGELVADVAAANLGEARVHHRQQADGDRQRDGADLDGVEGVVEARDESAQKEA